MKTKRILYVEDNQDNQMLIGLFLKNEPFELIPANTPAQALDILLSQSIDILIVDLNLQEEGDGITLIRSIRKLPDYNSVPIFVFSGMDKSHFNEYEINDQIQGFFHKPIRKQAFIEKLKMISDTEANHT